jgi:hypothetical protein
VFANENLHESFCLTKGNVLSSDKSVYNSVLGYGIRTMKPPPRDSKVIPRANDVPSDGPGREVCSKGMSHSTTSYFVVGQRGQFARNDASRGPGIHERLVR